MATGLNGYLVSTAFLESQLRANDDLASVDRATRALRAWRLRHAFGPASSVRTIFDAGAASLAELLGFEAPATITQIDSALAATLLRKGSVRSAVALIVAPWGTRLDSLWRTAVTEAIRRTADWC